MHFLSGCHQVADVGSELHSASENYIIGLLAASPRNAWKVYPGSCPSLAHTLWWHTAHSSQIGGFKALCIKRIIPRLRHA